MSRAGDESVCLSPARMSSKKFESVCQTRSKGAASRESSECSSSDCERSRNSRSHVFQLLNTASHTSCAAVSHDGGIEPPLPNSSADVAAEENEERFANVT